MKTQIAIYGLKDWAFKTEQGEEKTGSTAFFHLEGDYENYSKSSIRDDVLNMVRKTPLPAIFEADVMPSLKNGSIKYEIKTLKLVNSFKVF